MNCEIEFLPVGEASKAGDAIVVRYGTESTYEIMTIDGGNLDSGEQTVKHIHNQYGKNAIISHAVLTHADADHASGLRAILEQADVRNLWLHVPWQNASHALPYFANKQWTVAGLETAIRSEYDIIAGILELAEEKGINVQEPFAGIEIGPFVVLTPSVDEYALLLPQFDRTPDPDQEAIEAAGLWIGKAAKPGTLTALFQKAVATVKNWVFETWATEQLRDGGITTASNESSLVLYGFANDKPVLLTGDAGVRALNISADNADEWSLPLQQFGF